MVQLHDEPYALWRQAAYPGRFDRNRMEQLLGEIQDWNLFLAFQLVDGCVPGKSRAPLKWLFQQVAPRVPSRFGECDIR
jgi:hypothetical protein